MCVSDHEFVLGWLVMATGVVVIAVLLLCG